MIKHKILLLEDDMSLINGLTFAFKKQGFGSVVTRTVREAAAAWAAGRYALLRRSRDSGTQNTEIISNGIRLSLLQGQAYKNDFPLDLTNGEYKLLSLFMQNPSQILSKERILSKLWDSEWNYVDDNTLNVYIHRLRMKIEPDPGNLQST